jgi:uncharacterized protein
MGIIIFMIINRNYKKEFSISKIRLVYGRRKTGKSFFVENFVSFDKFFFIYRDKSISNIKTFEKINYNELKRYILDNKNKTIVIDEFHRLGDDFLDFLHSHRVNNIIIITSSLHIAKNILSKKSPVLGLVYPIEFDLIKSCELINNFKNNFVDLEYLLFFQEPTLLELYDKKESFKEFILKSYNFSKYWLPALFGEIFEDEDRKLSQVYEGVIRALSLGKNTVGEITTYLFNNNLISKESSGSISPYLDILIKIGVVKKIELLGKSKRFVYLLTSIPIDFFTYVNSKYGDNVSSSDLLSSWNNKISFYVEDFLSDLMSKYYGLKIIKYTLPNHEIDVSLLKHKKLNVIGSVKWSDKKIDFSLIKKNLDLDVENKFLFVKDKSKIDSVVDIKVYDQKDLIYFCK